MTNQTNTIALYWIRTDRTDAFTDQGAAMQAFAAENTRLGWGHPDVGRLVADHAGPVDTIDGAPVVAAAPDVDVLPNSEGWGAVLHNSAANTARVVAREREVVAAGFSAPPDTVFPVGSRVRRDGDQRLRAERQRWEQLPASADACDAMIERIRAERREDWTVDLAGSTMDDAGTLHLQDGTAIPMEPGGLDQILPYVRGVLPRAASLLHATDPDLRAEIWNRQVAKIEGPRTVQIRTRVGADGERAVWAVVGERYTPVDAHEVLRMYQDASVGMDLRGTVDYDPTRGRLTIDAGYHVKSEDLPNFSAGDFTAGGVRVRSADDGSGSIRGEGSILRNLCLNYIITGTSTDGGFRLVHKGDRASLVSRLRAHLRESIERVAAVFPDLETLATTPIAAVFGADTPIADVFETVPDLATLPKGIKRDAAVEALLQGYALEPGENLDAIVNAVTRVHTPSLGWDADDIADMEAYAGRLVPVLVRAAADA
jgi:hypothetical protein